MKATLSALLCAATLMVACIGGAFLLTLLASPALVTSRGVGLPWSRVQGDYWRIIGYLLLPGGVSPLHLRWFPVDAKVVRHFADVRELVQRGLLGALIAGWIASGLLHQLLRTWQAWRLLWLLPRVMLFLAVGGILFLLNFNAAFLWLHYHAFANMDWVFSPQKEPLIKLWPPTFFLTLAAGWGSLSEGLLLLIYYWLKWRLGLLMPPATDKTHQRRDQGDHDDAQDDD